jgi:MFS family permease
VKKKNNSIGNDSRFIYIILANIFSSIGSGITSLTISWLIVQQPDGAQVYGYTFIGVTLTSFFLSPYIGSIIDKYPRKNFLLFSQIWGFSFVLALAFIAHSQDSLTIWQLVILQVVGSLYWNFVFPGIFAFVHEIFQPDQYQKLNSVLEVQNQVASMLSAGIAGLIMTHIHVSTILFIDAMTYLIGFFLFLAIPYTKQNQKNRNQKVHYLESMKEGFIYLRKMPWISLFFICTLSPFIVIMIGNYLDPIHVLHTLKANPSALGTASALYAIGAIFSGIFITKWMKKRGSHTTILCTVIISLFSTLCIALSPHLSLFYLAALGKGIGNAGTRICRNTMMMEMVPNHIIGRIRSCIDGVGLGIRVMSVSIFTTLMGTIGTRGSYFTLSIFLLFSGIIIYLSKSAIDFAIYKRTKKESISSL